MSVETRRLVGTTVPALPSPADWEVVAELTALRGDPAGGEGHWHDMCQEVEDVVTALRNVGFVVERAAETP
jgi:hypothetical protein